MPAGTVDSSVGEFVPAENPLQALPSAVTYIKLL